jgi:hypothetical protein
MKKTMEIKLTSNEILSQPNDYSLGEYVRKKYWEQVEINKSNKDEHVSIQVDENGKVVSLGNTSTGFEICVQCGLTTSIPVETNIDYRTNYIEGAGQGCDGTCNKI